MAWRKPFKRHDGLRVSARERPGMLPGATLPEASGTVQSAFSLPRFASLFVTSYTSDRTQDGFMSTRGKLIAVEGIDGSGKGTQVRLLARELGSQGYRVLSTGFPQYESWFGKMVGQFLNGDFGPLDSVDPHFTALLYAGDRFECKQPIVEALESGGIVLADRYIASNLA